MSGLTIERASYGASGTSTQSSEAWQCLRQLRTSGQLLARYHEVPALLAQMDQAQLRRAGSLLARLNTEEILLHHAQNSTATSLTVANIAVIGNSTISPLIEPLTLELARHGILLRSYIGGYGEYLFDLGSAHSPLYTQTPQPELTLCLLDAQVVFDQLTTPWNVVDVEQKLQALYTRINALTVQFQTSGSGQLVINTIPLPRGQAHQLLDYASRMQLGAVWRDFNARLLRMGVMQERLLVIDMDVLLTATDALSDARTSLYAKLHFSDALLQSYAREAVHIWRAVQGRGKKCLVLDLDGTLWGGVLGDAGVQGITLGHHGEGEAFIHFQRVVQQIASQGVLLAIASKNDEATVRAALRDHPDMQLQESAFVVVNANWGPKDSNIVAIAKQLNLGNDSLVFVDDSNFECGLVRLSLPEVAVIQVDADPALHAESLLHDSWFVSLQLTAEDYTRHQKYAAEIARQQFQEKFSSLADYLSDLKIAVDLYVPGSEDVPRLSQLTLRTNQFNLTTLRMSDADVLRQLANPDALVIVIRSRDRFGDNGIVGAIFTHQGYADNIKTLTIQNMLLSCRVFSREIEQACLRALLAYAQTQQIHVVRGIYKASSKNTRFADFYMRQGFVATGNMTEDGGALYSHDLQQLPPAVTHIVLTTAGLTILSKEQSC